MPLPSHDRSPADYLRVARDPGTGAGDLRDLAGRGRSAVARDGG